MPQKGIANFPAIAQSALSLSNRGHVIEAIELLGEALSRARVGEEADILLLRAQMYINRRDYPKALDDINRAIAIDDNNAGARLERAEFFILTNRPEAAELDFREALRISPDEEKAHLSYLSFLAQRGLLDNAKTEIQRLLKHKNSTISFYQALFYSGYCAFKKGLPSSATRLFAQAMQLFSAEHSLSSRAGFYRTTSLIQRYLKPDQEDRKMGNLDSKGASLSLCGLGIFPPYTASVEVLHALSRCDILFNNVAGMETREFISLFSNDIRPLCYQASSDESRWADEIFSEIERGHSVAFVTRGHPLVFGGLARELVRRCRESKIPCRSYGAVSSIDHILAYTGLSLGDDWGGIQLLDWSELKTAPSINTNIPLLATFYNHLSESEMPRLERLLRKFYPQEHPCWMFGPQYDREPAALSVSRLCDHYPKIHSSLMLFLPPDRKT